MSWKDKERAEVERHWNYNQLAIVAAILCSVFLPLAWGLTSSDKWGWMGYVKFVAFKVTGIAVVGEAVRRYSNWSFREPVCKWIWQK